MRFISKPAEGRSVFPTAHKSVPFSLQELKAENDQFVVSGLASTFGNLDHTGDVVMRGAFDATLASGRKRRFLWQHDVSEPIGVEQDMRVTDAGLLGTWKISRTTRGIDAYELLKDGAVDSLSIGYVPTDFEFDDAGVRLLKAVDLLEVSLVSIPANDQAVVTNVKADWLADLVAQHKAINLDVPFDALLSQLVEGITYGATEAEALWQRRQADGREPKAEHLAAVTSLRSAVEAASARLDALLAQKAKAEADAEGDDQNPAEDAADVPSAASADPSLRLELARRKVRMLGLLERAS
jgi:HK97 family phage prohead protease